MKKKIYIDHNATTPLKQEVLEAMMPYLKGGFGNASSLHLFGQETKKALEDSREKTAKLIGADSADEIIFTGCGTESDNMAVKGVAFANARYGKHLITTAIEHHAVLNSFEYLASKGFETEYLSVDNNSIIDPKQVLGSIKDTTTLVSVMHANNEVGAIQPLEEIGALLGDINNSRIEKGLNQVYFHSDAVQSCGKISINVNKLGVDLLSVSAHKFYGPKGVGFQYIRKGTIIEPLLHGGHHERNYRAGTENIAGIVGMTAALELACGHMDKEQERIKRLRDKLEKGILSKVPEAFVNGHPEKRLAGTLNVNFKYIEGESLLLMLDMEGIAASTGSACASGSSEPSHVLKAMCVPAADAQGALRFSLGAMNTESDIEYILEVLPRVVSRLRDMSPVWKAVSKKI